MSAVALVRNRLSTRNLDRASEPVPAGVRLIDCDGFAALEGGLRAAHAAGASAIVVDGGDGTVREVLSRLPAIWGAAPPAIGILPHGNTNLIARKFGRLRDMAEVARLAAMAGSGAALPTRRHAVLRVDYPAAEHAPLRGFILGWGAYAAATEIARAEIHARGTRQVALATLSVVRRTVLGAGGARLRRGVAARGAADGVNWAGGPCFVGIATTLQGPLVAGLSPFWGEGPGPIRWLDIAAPARWLAVAAPFVALGRPMGWMLRAGYASGRAGRIELGLDSPFVMDGEVFSPAKSGPLVLTAAEEVGFLAL